MYHKNQASGLSLLEQKRLQWAREREEMTGLYGLWGTLDKSNNEKSKTQDQRFPPRRNSLLPPIQNKCDDHPREEESETSGYLSDSPQHEYESSTDSQSGTWAAKSDNFWGDKKAQKNLRNERRLRGTPDSLLSTPEDRMKWGDRGVGVGHLWEPVVELPESRLPQVLEAYRATPKWLERGLKLSDSNGTSANADILVIHHDNDGEDEEEDEGSRPSANFILGQNVPLPPEILEERDRRRRKALEHQNAIRRQLEERERKRKEEKESRLREERIEEERIRKERELERLRQEEEIQKTKEREKLEKQKEEAMRDALELAERNARDNKRKKKREPMEETEKIDVIEQVQKCESPVIPPTPRLVKDSSCQSEQQLENVERSVVDSCSQSDGLQNLQFLNEAGGVALVLDGSQTGGILMPPDAVQLLLMSPSLPVQRPERVLTPSKLRYSRLMIDVTTQTDRRKCCSTNLCSDRSRKSTKRSGRTSVRSDSSDKSTSLEGLNSHSHCTSSYKHRSRSQPRLNMGERPKWGINRPSVQYMKQSEKDPHYLRRIKRRSRRTKDSSTSMNNPEEKLLDSEIRHLAFQTDEEIDDNRRLTTCKVLENGFRMVSNPASPKFVRIDSQNEETSQPVQMELPDEIDAESKVDNSRQPELTNFAPDFPNFVPDLESNFLNNHDFEISVEPAEVDNISSVGLPDEILNSTPSLKVSGNSPDDSADMSNSEPSSARSEQVDEADDDDDSDSVVIGHRPSINSDALGQIESLRKGLERLQREVDSRCSTPMSPKSDVQ